MGALAVVLVSFCPGETLAYNGQALGVGESTHFSFEKMSALPDPDGLENISFSGLACAPNHGLCAVVMASRDERLFQIEKDVGRVIGVIQYCNAAVLRRRCY